MLMSLMNLDLEEILESKVKYEDSEDYEVATAKRKSDYVMHLYKSSKLRKYSQELLQSVQIWYKKLFPSGRAKAVGVIPKRDSSNKISYLEIVKVRSNYTVRTILPIHSSRSFIPPLPLFYNNWET